MARKRRRARPPGPPDGWSSPSARKSSSRSCSGSAHKGATPVNPLAQFRQTYFEECAGLLEEMQASLELLSDDAADDETLHAIFRCVHSIKGGAGAFGYQALVAFSHLFESLLDELRDHKMPPTRDVVQVLL